MLAVQTLVLIFLLGVVSGYGNWNETHICCDGITVTERDQSSSIYCCGTQVYDSERQICCANTLTDRPDNNSSTYYGCCLNEETMEQTPFDYSRFACCKTKIVEKPDKDVYYSCCGDELFRYSESFCCDNKIIPRSPNQECCNENMPYDSTLDLCSSDYNKETHEWTYTLLAIENNHTDVCNKQLYDTQTHACCSDQVVKKEESQRDILYPGCCGAGTSIKTYNYSSHVCCDSTGELLPIPEDIARGVWPECCAGQIFTNYTYQQCCNDKIIDRPAQYQGYCCGSQMVIDYNSQFCCNDVIYNRSDIIGQLNCCSETLYDNDKEYCCGGILYDVEVKFAGCCYRGRNAEVYDRRIEGCDQNGVTQLSPDEIEMINMFANASDPLCVQMPW